MKHWIIDVLLLVAVAVLGFLLYMQSAFQKESDASAGRALAQLATWVEAGETGLVCHAVTNAHEILSESGFNGMSFEKIMWMSESDMKESEPAPRPVPSKAAALKPWGLEAVGSALRIKNNDLCGSEIKK